jgi:hypothetical protein
MAGVVTSAMLGGSRLHHNFAAAMRSHFDRHAADPG